MSLLWKHRKQMESVTHCCLTYSVKMAPYWPLTSESVTRCCLTYNVKMALYWPLSQWPVAVSRTMWRWHSTDLWISDPLLSHVQCEDGTLHLLTSDLWVSDPLMSHVQCEDGTLLTSESVTRCCLTYNVKMALYTYWPLTSESVTRWCLTYNVKMALYWPLSQWHVAVSRTMWRWHSTPTDLWVSDPLLSHLVCEDGTLLTSESVTRCCLTYSVKMALYWPLTSESVTRCCLTYNVKMALYWPLSQWPVAVSRTMWRWHSTDLWVSDPLLSHVQCEDGTLLTSESVTRCCLTYSVKMALYTYWPLTSESVTRCCLTYNVKMALYWPLSQWPVAVSCTMWRCHSTDLRVSDPLLSHVQCEDGTLHLLTSDFWVSDPLLSHVQCEDGTLLTSESVTRCCLTYSVKMALYTYWPLTSESVTRCCLTYNVKMALYWPLSQWPVAVSCTMWRWHPTDLWVSDQLLSHVQCEDGTLLTSDLWVSDPLLSHVQCEDGTLLTSESVTRCCLTYSVKMALYWPLSQWPVAVSRTMWRWHSTDLWVSDPLLSHVQCEDGTLLTSESVTSCCLMYNVKMALYWPLTSESVTHYCLTYNVKMALYWPLSQWPVAVSCTMWRWHPTDLWVSDQLLSHVQCEDGTLLTSDLWVSDPLLSHVQREDGTLLTSESVTRCYLTYNVKMALYWPPSQWPVAVSRTMWRWRGNGRTESSCRCWRWFETMPRFEGRTWSRRGCVRVL